MKMKNLKKALAFTGVLAFLGAGTVFAQDEDRDEAAEETVVEESAPANAGWDVAGGKLILGAYINSGVEIDKFKDNDVTIKPFGQQVWSSGRAQVDLNWTSGDETFGAKIRLRANDVFGTKKDGTSRDYFYPHYAYGWYKPIQYFSVSGGYVDDQAFATEGDFGDYALDITSANGAAPGGLIHILPIDILDLGFGVFAPPDATPVDAGDNTIYYAGAAVNTKLVNLHGSAAIQKDLKNALFSVSTGAISNLTVALEGSIFNENNNIGSISYINPIDGFTIPGKTNHTYGFWGDLSAAYSLGDLGISLVAYYFANDYDAGGPTAYVDWRENYYGDYDTDQGIIDFTFQPGVSYSLLGGKVVPGLKFLFGYGKGSPFGLPVEVSQTRIQVKPYIDLPIGGAQLELAYQLQHDKFNVDVNVPGYQSYGDAAADAKTGFTHTVYVDFTWKY